ncbi:paired amphipathic helix [Aspergillus alliaceus]|uniref:paired amphipathic helix n=1 Tax=Petromyces alliaceus TaxID=209559 RepID=UPI0012A595FF|nr:paired amphipathic helix [Aspergillus alliaceus]KAB8236695.1 paired amphipathic helix [Aspergillus alliaceus]
MGDGNTTQPVQVGKSEMLFTTEERVSRGSNVRDVQAAPARDVSGSTSTGSDDSAQEDGAPDDSASRGPPRDTSKDSRQEGCLSLGDAASYIQKIKNRFADNPEIYQEFFLMLHDYQQGSLPLRELYEQVGELFISAPDLVAEFQRFLPEATAYRQVP